jgi:hypothetical protein
MSRSKDKGTAWETAVATYLQESGWPYAERRALNGNHDRGDITGVAGACIEAKSASRVELAEWLKEMQTEKANANATVGAVWFKRRGKTSPGDGFVLMDGNQFVQLLKEAGYQ